MNTTLLLFVIVCSAFNPQNPRKLQDMLHSLSLATSIQPTESGQGWKKWQVGDNHWDSILAIATGSDPNRYDLVTAMKDSVPLLGLVSTERKKRYQVVKCDKSLHRGWEASAFALSAKGVVDFVQLSFGEEEIYIGSDESSILPKYLAKQIGDSSFLVLAWNKSGDEFESIMYYDVYQKSVISFSNFALHNNGIEYIFFKGENEEWLEFSFTKNSNTPTGVAIHKQMPGKIERALIDMNQDGKMEVLAELSSNGKQVSIKKTDIKWSVEDIQKTESFKKKMVSQVIIANEIWLDAQWLWSQWQPLGVQLPELFK